MWAEMAPGQPSEEIYPARWSQNHVARLSERLRDLLGWRNAYAESVDICPEELVAI
jgi:hypothetical protein